MNIQFYKFDGAGNDFVLIDAREHDPQLSTEAIARMCHRRFGVGADGLMLLKSGEEGYDFVMKYYNSDGRTASMCGNGGRCIAVFAYLLGLGTREPSTPQNGQGAERTLLRFRADDGPHDAEIVAWDKASGKGIVKLGMRDVRTDEVRRVLDGWLLNTGVPHYVQRVEDLERFDVVGEGRRIRHLAELGAEGANVNFVEDMPDSRLRVRTYERGVEDETWACGTGVTACSIVSGNHRILTRGGDFNVDFTPTDQYYKDVKLTGPVSFDFKGEVELIEN
ncbi:MAG: diaminopimelate epimerase [Bacteroidales bacterium]|nr:diaminopimelate epimerase [Bacteroidales bacterium]